MRIANIVLACRMYNQKVETNEPTHEKDIQEHGISTTAYSIRVVKI